jgi:hypothetical protein
MRVAKNPATDGRMYAFEGELIGTQGYLVELADESFHLTPRMTVPDVGHVRGLLAANPQLLVVGPFTENTINTSSVRTRLSPTSMQHSFWHMREGSPRATISTRFFP